MQKNKLCITMPPDAVEQLDELCSYTRLSKSVLLTRLVDEYHKSVLKKIKRGGKAGVQELD